MNTSSNSNKIELREQLDKIYSLLNYDDEIESYHEELDIQNYLKNIVCAGNQFFIILDMCKRQIDYVSKNYFSLMKLKTLPCTVEDLYQFLHREDWAIALTINDLIFKYALPVPRKPFEESFEFTIRHNKGNGETRWFMQDYTCLQVDRTGVTLKLLILYTDIHPLKKDNTLKCNYIGPNKQLLPKIKEVLSQYEAGKQNILSSRESEILSLITCGFDSKTIARKLCLSKHTIDTYRRKLLSKFNVRNTLELINYTIDNKLIN